MLEPWVRRGMVYGPGEQANPRIVGEVEFLPGQLGLTATVEATLRPWNHHLHLRVLLRPPSSPHTVELS